MMNDDCAQYLAEFKAECENAIEGKESSRLDSLFLDALRWSSSPVGPDMAVPVFEYILDVISREDLRTMPGGGAIVGSTLGMVEFINGGPVSTIRSALLGAACMSDADDTFPMAFADRLSRDCADDPQTIDDLFQLDQARVSINANDDGRLWVLESLGRVARRTTNDEIRLRSLHALQARTDDASSHIAHHATAHLKSAKEKLRGDSASNDV